jgi:hypothetical protein
MDGAGWKAETEGEKSEGVWSNSAKLEEDVLVSC